MTKNILRAAILAVVLAMGGVGLSGCSSTQITTATTDIAAYGKLATTTLAVVGNVAVSIECSAIPATASTTASSIINIVAPTSTQAAEAATIISDNAQIAAQLCPLYKQVVATVGTVSGATSTINIPASASVSISPRVSHCGTKSTKPFEYVCQ